MPRKTISAAKWAAIRALAEGELPTYATLATACDVYETTIVRHSSGGGWAKLDCRKPAVIIAFRAAQAVNTATDGDVAPGEMVARAAWAADGGRGTFLPAPGLPEGDDTLAETVSADEVRGRLAELLPRQLAKVIALAERGVVDKGRLDALIAMLRVVERADVLAAEQQQINEKKSDEELAELHAKLDARIVELAEGYAERLFAGERPGQAD